MATVRETYERLAKLPRPVMRLSATVVASNRTYKIHREQLEKVASREPGVKKLIRGADHTLPYSSTVKHLQFGHKTYGGKRKAAKEARQRDIRRENVRLIRDFASIISTPTEFETAAVEHKVGASRALMGMQREQKRINQSNAYNAERLRKLNPVYAKKKWDRDRMDQLVFLKRHMKDFSLLDQKSKVAPLEAHPSMSEISRARNEWCRRRAKSTPERDAKVQRAVEKAKQRLKDADKRLAELASGKARRLKQIRAKVKGEVLDEESEDEYGDDDFDMPAGFGFADDTAKRPGTTKPKVRETGRPGTTMGRGRGGNKAPRGEDGFHPDEHYGDDGFDDDSDYNEDGFDADELRAYHKHNEDAGLEPSARARTPLRPVTPLEEPIIGHYGDPGLDTPYTVGRFPLVTSDALSAAKPGTCSHALRRDDLKACDATGKPTLPLELEVETERDGDAFTVTFLAKVRGGGGSKTTHAGKLPVLCAMDDDMAAYYLNRLAERVLKQACVDYGNAKSEAQLRDERTLAADLARYVAFKESFHAPPSFTSPDKYKSK